MPPVPAPDLASALAPLTTLRLGGPARAWVRATTEDELVAAVSAADAAGELVCTAGATLVHRAEA